LKNNLQFYIVKQNNNKETKNERKKKNKWSKKFKHW